MTAMNLILGNQIFIKEEWEYHGHAKLDAAKAAAKRRTDEVCLKHMAAINLDLRLKQEGRVRRQLQCDADKRLTLSANAAIKSRTARDKNRSYIQDILDLRARITAEGLSFGIADATIRAMRQAGIDAGVSPVLTQALTVADPQGFMAIDAEHRLFDHFGFERIWGVSI